MSKNTIVTIGREFGSGGREIGKKLAEQLNIPFYDKELINLAAKESGMSPEVFEAADEQATNSLLYSMSVGAFSLGNHITNIADMPVNDKLFLLQCNIIKKIAQKSSCVIVGRCAYYVLQGRANCLNVFIRGDMPQKIERIGTLYNMPPKKAEEVILKTDKRRKNYYNYYTGLKWGRMENYDLILNSSQFGIDNCVKILQTLFELN